MCKAGESSRKQDKLLANQEYNQKQNNVHTNINIQNRDAPQENNLYMGDECLFDMSDGVDPHESHSYKTNMSIEQSPLQ